MREIAVTTSLYNHLGGETLKGMTDRSGKVAHFLLIDRYRVKWMVYPVLAPRRRREAEEPSGKIEECGRIVCRLVIETIQRWLTQVDCFRGAANSLSPDPA